jgi:hypothetical protein
MKAVLLAAVLFAARAAHAATPYAAATAAVVGVSTESMKQVDALLDRPSDAALRGDPRVDAFLVPSQNALELFRRAADIPSDGYLFQPKIEHYDEHSPMPRFFDHLKLYRLLLLDAKMEALRGREIRAESDLLAAMKFTIQTSLQRSGVLISVITEQVCLEKAAPLLADSARRRAASSAYLKELASLLDQLDRDEDFMAAAFLEDSAKYKGAIRNAVTPEILAKAREKLPFLQRITAKKLQDGEYLQMVYSLHDALSDEATSALLAACRANDPAIQGAYFEKRAADLAAHKKAREALSEWAKFVDISTGGNKTKRLMAETFVDALYRPNDFRKIVTLHSVFLGELGVLRAGLAVERYRRDRKRLPESLDALVPAYLPAVPRDPFNRFAPVRYVPAGKSFLVYGLGPTRKDDGGAAVLDWSGMHEDFTRDSGSIVFRD